MSWKNRNQNNIIPFKQGVENKQKIEAEDRIRMIVGSIDVKMQQPYWDALVFDDQELQLLSNFGETIKFPHDNTAVRALSILATYILKKELDELINAGLSLSAASSYLAKKKNITKNKIYDLY